MILNLYFPEKGYKDFFLVGEKNQAGYGMKVILFSNTPDDVPFGSMAVMRTTYKPDAVGRLSLPRPSHVRTPGPETSASDFKTAFQISRPDKSTMENSNRRKFLSGRLYWIRRLRLNGLGYAPTSASRKIARPIFTFAK